MRKKFYFRVWEIEPGYFNFPVMTFSTALPKEEVRRMVPEKFQVFGPYDSYKESVEALNELFYQQEFKTLMN